VTKSQRNALTEALSHAFVEANSLVTDLLDLCDSKDKRIEELESQVEELENDKMTLLSKGRDLEDVVEDLEDSE